MLVLLLVGQVRNEELQHGHESEDIIQHIAVCSV